MCPDFGCDKARYRQGVAPHVQGGTDAVPVVRRLGDRMTQAHRRCPAAQPAPAWGLNALARLILSS